MRLCRSLLFLCITFVIWLFKHCFQFGVEIPTLVYLLQPHWSSKFDYLVHILYKYFLILFSFFVAQISNAEFTLVQSVQENANLRSQIAQSPDKVQVIFFIWFTPVIGSMDIQINSFFSFYIPIIIQVNWF